MPVRVRLLLLLASLSVAAVALLATHCEGYPECGHVEGAACPSSACVNLPLPGNGSPLICAGGSGGGGSGPGAPTPTAVPTSVPQIYWQIVGSQYSYEDGCALGDNIDPVTTVLRRGFNAEDVNIHLVSIGLDHGTDHQDYLDNGSCVEGEIGVADNGDRKLCFPQIICAQERWHVRCNVVSTADPTGGVWASCTPHWDSSDGSPFDQCSHLVRPVYDGNENFTGSGFVAGKDWLWWELVAERGYHFEGGQPQYWENLLENEQCNGEFTGSDGYVNVIWLAGNP